MTAHSAPSLDHDNVGRATLDQATLDQLCVTAMRTLAIDAVQQANSGHPGTPMGMSPVVYALWQRVLRFDPVDPHWPNRDRFVLSSGHASMLLYSVLHLTGTREFKNGDATGQPAVSLDDIKSFRQRGSRCAGHPEYRWTSGVETTTGPLGQGVATSVGMAIASRWLAARYNRPGFDLFDHDVYALCGDGCLMEGVSAEAASLAGHLGLSNLCWIYDSNRITIEGETDLAFTEDVGTRFAAYGWHVVYVTDANDLDQVEHALASFCMTIDRPTLIVVDSHIGFGSPNRQDTSAAHGEALGADEVRLTKRAYGWPEDKPFHVPAGVREHFDAGIGHRGRTLRAEWNALVARYREHYPQAAAELQQMLDGELPADWAGGLPVFPADAKGVSGRDASGRVLNAISSRVPWVIGGAADLAPSTKTRLTGDAGDLRAAEPSGRNLHFGVREHAMGAVLNGLALSHLRPFGAGFLIFSDYARGAIRLSALMELPVVHIFTHDSIGVGEDGPTHQPIEQLVSLRAVPNLLVLRPADANEVVEAWRLIMRSHRHPVALVLTRQAVPTLDRTCVAPADGLAKGAYVLADPPVGTPDVLLMASGSEVSLCLSAVEPLAAEGIRARVVSMPSWELFEQQPVSYRDAVLPPSITARVAVEQASMLGWDRYAGADGATLGMTTFGMSAPFPVLQQEFGFTTARIVALARGQVAKAARALEECAS
jgi:transketolase